MFKRFIAVALLLILVPGAMAAESENVVVPLKGILILTPGFRATDISITDREVISAEMFGNDQIRVTGLAVGKSDLHVTAGAVAKLYTVTVTDNVREVFNSLRRDLENEPERPRAERAAEPLLHEDGADRLVKAKRFILASVLFGAKYAKNFDLSGVRFSDPVHNTIAGYILGQKERGEPVRASALFDIFEENTPELDEILNLSIGESLLGEGGARYFEDCLRTIRRADAEAELKELSARCDAEPDIAKKREIVRRIGELTVQLKNF